MSNKARKSKFEEYIRWVVFAQIKEHDASFYANTTAVNRTTRKPTTGKRAKYNLVK